jgi:drug/metabolite transporter (DMT)-like permease
MDEIKKNYKVLAALLAVYIIWGSTYLGIKYAVETIPPFLHAALRFTLSGAFLFVWRVLARDAMPTMKQWRSAAIVGTLLLVGGNGFISLSETKIPSGVAALIVASMPIFMILVDFVFYRSHKPTLVQIVGLVIGFGGVFYLLNPWDTAKDITHFSVGYSLLALLASFLWSLGSVYSRQAPKPDSLLMYTGMQMLIGSFGLFVMSFLFGEYNGFHFANVSASSWWGFTYLVTVGSLVGFTSYAYLLKHASVSLISTYPYVNPIVAIILGNLMAGESLTSRILISAAIIISSIILINWQKKK